MSDPTQSNSNAVAAAAAAVEPTTLATSEGLPSTRYHPRLYSRPRGRYQHDQQQGGGAGGGNGLEGTGTSRKVGINISFRLSMLGAIDKVAARQNTSRSAFVAKAVADMLQQPEIRAILEDNSPQ